MKQTWRVVAVSPKTERAVEARKCDDDELLEVVRDFQEHHPRCDICCFRIMI